MRIYKNAPLTPAGREILVRRGLNSGFADANNLGWKPAAVIGSRAGDRLLDSYSSERRAATMDIFDQAGKSTIFMTPPTRGYRLMRDAVLSLSVHEAFVRGLIDPRQSAPYDYTDGPLTTFKARDAGFGAGPRAGTPLRNLRLASAGAGAAGFLLDHLAAGFNGLYFHGGGALADGVAALFDEGLFHPLVVAGAAGEAAAATVLADPERRVFAACGAAAGSFYLVRPDGHVAARWPNIEPDEVRRAVRIALAAHDAE